MPDILSNLTTEDFQRYARIALQWLASFLVTRGMIDSNASWLEPAIGVGVALTSLAWTLYSNRLKAKVVEVAKSPEVKQVVLHDRKVVSTIPNEKVVFSGYAE